MDTPAVGVLAGGLILEERHDQRFTDGCVRVKEERPRWVDDIHSVHTLLQPSVLNYDRRGRCCDLQHLSSLLRSWRVLLVKITQ